MNRLLVLCMANDEDDSNGDESSFATNEKARVAETSEEDPRDKEEDES